MDEGNRLDLVEGLNVQISLGAAAAGGIGGRAVEEREIRAVGKLVVSPDVIDTSIELVSAVATGERERNELNVRDAVESAADLRATDQIRVWTGEGQVLSCGSRGRTNVQSSGDRPALCCRKPGELASGSKYRLNTGSNAGGTENFRRDGARPVGYDQLSELGGFDPRGARDILSVAPETFVREEDEEPALANGTPEAATKLPVIVVHTSCRRIVRPAILVECVPIGVLIFEEAGAMVLVCAALCDDFNLCAAAPTVFSGIGTREHGNFLDGLLVGSNHRCTAKLQAVYADAVD